MIRTNLIRKGKKPKFKIGDRESSKVERVERLRSMRRVSDEANRR